MSSFEKFFAVLAIISILALIVATTWVAESKIHGASLLVNITGIASVGASSASAFFLNSGFIFAIVFCVIFWLSALSCAADAKEERERALREQSYPSYLDSTSYTNF